jgi:low affinity Fe/Cu permease
MRRKFKNRFRQVANIISQWAGSAGVFLGAILIVLVWASSGPLFKFSDTWQLVINTGTTIITFLMVFLIQNTQNRDTKAIQLKLDELIHSTKTARDTFVGLEELTDEELAELDNEFKKLSQDPTTAKALAKLHRKIEAEHAKRLTLRSQAGKVVGALLKPLTVKPITTQETSRK